MTKLNVLYEDNHIIVVEKPINVLSQSDSTKDLDLLSMVKSYVKEKYNKPGEAYIGLIHRLDRPVGGVMVFARTSKAAARLTKQFNEHSVVKKYLAIVHGKVEQSGTFKDKLLKLPNGNSIVDDKGKDAVLDYKLIKYLEKEDLSLVDINLGSGRHHQIRVQFSSRGFPIVGDQRYGTQDKEQICLFSYYLEFVHPVKKEKVFFEIKPSGKYWDLFVDSLDSV